MTMNGSGLFGCAICGSGGELFHQCCAACAEKVMEAWHGPATDDEFEAWWKLYPRKVGKDAAREKFGKARKRVSAEALMQAVKVYMQTKPDYADWCHPATWLNQGRWQDEQESYDCGPAIDMDRKHVEDFVRTGFWLTSWGPTPTEPDAEPRVRRLYEETKAPGF